MNLRYGNRRLMEELFNQFGWRITMEEASLPDGHKKKTPRIERCDSVHILAFLEPETLLLLREFRPFYDEWIWMLPSGRVDKETDVIAAAQRELQEETGYRAEFLKHYSTTHQSESIKIANHLFLAHDLVKDPLTQDDDERIEVHSVSVEDAIQKVLQSPVVHTVSAYGLLRYAHEQS